MYCVPWRLVRIVFLLFVLFSSFSQLIVSDQIDTLFRYQRWLKCRLSFATALALLVNIVASITVPQTDSAPIRLNSKDKGASKRIYWICWGYTDYILWIFVGESCDALRASLKFRYVLSVMTKSFSFTSEDHDKPLVESCLAKFWTTKDIISQHFQKINELMER